MILFFYQKLPGVNPVHSRQGFKQNKKGSSREEKQTVPEVNRAIRNKPWKELGAAAVFLREQLCVKTLLKGTILAIYYF